jgi:hypothetical protein
MKANIRIALLSPSYFYPKDCSGGTNENLKKVRKDTFHVAGVIKGT